MCASGEAPLPLAVCSESPWVTIHRFSRCLVIARELPIQCKILWSSQDEFRLPLPSNYKPLRVSSDVHMISRGFCFWLAISVPGSASYELLQLRCGYRISDDIPCR